MRFASELIRELLKAERVSVGELAERLKISRQAMYKRLEGNMSSASFLECIEALGYEVELKKR